MKSSFKTLIIGLGHIGMLYDRSSAKENVFTHAKAVHLHKNFNLVGGVDIDKVNRDYFEGKYKTQAFRSIKEALSKIEAEIFIVSSPTITHKDIILDLLKYQNPKAILCEKPLAYKTSDANLIVDLCCSKNVPLYVNYIRSCDPGVLEVASMIKKNQIQFPIKGTCWYSKGIFNSGSHFLNLLEFWFGDVREAILLNNKNPDFFGDPNPEFILSFKNVDITFQSYFSKKYTFNNLFLFCQNGKLTFEKEANQLYWRKVGMNNEFLDSKFLSGKKIAIQSQMHKYQLNVLDILSKELNNQKTSLCDGKQALNTIKLINNIIEQK